MSELSNYIPIGRTLFEHRFWCEERTYSRFEAWIDLIQMARFEDGKKYVGNKVLLIKRGQIHATYRFLSERWVWSSKKVGGFLDLLISDEMITKETQKETGQTLITICNYEKYNTQRYDKETQKETARKRQGNAKETNIKKENKENNVNSLSLPRESDSFVSVSSLCESLIDSMWIEKIGMEYRSTPDGIRDYLKSFTNELTLKGDGVKSERDYKSHFINWLKIEMKKNGGATHKSNFGREPEKRSGILSKTDYEQKDYEGTVF